MPDNTRAIVDFAYDDNGKEFRDALYSAIHDKVTSHIDLKKQEIARNLIVQPEQETEVKDQEELTTSEE
jgi:hypothetical protein